MAAKQMKKGLGRGLDALMESVETQEHQGKVLTLSIYEIDTNPDQPRKTFDEEKLTELAESIRRHGIVQPLVVAPKGQRYIIVAGERRFRAARLAGLKTVPAICMEAEEGALQEVSLIENIQREDLNPVEEAAAIRFLMDQHDLTQEEVAQRISKSRPAVANSLRLLTLPKSIQTLMKEGKLSVGHGKILAGLEDKKQAEELGKRAAEENWSVRRLEDTLRLLNANRSRKKSGDPYLRRMAGAFRSRLGARVAINGDQQKGKIVISYYSPEDLDAIYEAILGREEE